MIMIMITITRTVNRESPADNNRGKVTICESIASVVFYLYRECKSIVKS